MLLTRHKNTRSSHHASEPTSSNSRSISANVALSTGLQDAKTSPFDPPLIHPSVRLPMVRRRARESRAKRVFTIHQLRPSPPYAPRAAHYHDPGPRARGAGVAGPASISRAIPLGTG